MKSYKYILLILAIVIPLLALYIYYAFYSVEDTGRVWVNQCTIYKFTGLDCPGCGGQRAIHSLLHGYVLQALRYNGLFVLASPFLAYFYYIAIRVYILGQKQYLNSFVFKPWFAYLFISILIIFFILRNIPFWPFTLLSPA